MRLNSSTRILGSYNADVEEENIGIIMGKFTDKQQVEFANEDAIKIFGFTKEQFKAEVLENSQSLELFKEKSIHNDITNMLKTDTPIRFETKIKRRDDTKIRIVGNGSVVIDENGIKSCIFTFRSISNLLQEDKQQNDLKSVAQNIALNIVVCTLEEGYPIVYVNESFANTLGYTYDEMKEVIKDDYINLVAPEDRNYLCEQISTQLKWHKNFIVEYKLIKKDGQRIWVEEVSVIVDRTGVKSLMQCTIKDITRQKEKEKALLISEKRYDILLKNSNVSLFDYDIRTKVMLIQESESLEYNLPTYIENAVDTIEKSGIILPISTQAFRTLFQKIDEGEPTASALIYTINKKGKNGIFELCVTNIFDDRGQQLIALGTKKDITETIMLQREKEFSDTLTSDRSFVYESNITKNEIISYDKKWLSSLPIENPEIVSYSKFINHVVTCIVHPEHLSEATNYLSAKSIMAAFESGKRLISLTYRKEVRNLDYRWVKNTINIIKDELSGDINARCYIQDITELKEKELAVLEEKKFYEKVLEKAKMVYTVNISQNRLVSGHEKWGESLAIEQTDNYEQIMGEISKKIIYPADQSIAQRTFLCQNLLHEYETGNDRILCSYRIPGESGDFTWMQCVMSLFKHPHTEDITGYSYVVNIDQEKKEELELIYRAEHDALTDFYNKSCTEKHITDFLTGTIARTSIHAFFIIDIDRFKAINDNFGHIFGDVILSQVSGKIAKLFREKDVLGRIGGDEFVVFMKNIQSKKDAIERAKEICASVVDVFTQNGTDYRVSASIGIAFYDEHGKTYQELYKHSDSALYVSKENGRDQYTVYSQNMHPSQSAVKDIDSGSLFDSKRFARNITEYVFRIMHGAKNKKVAIESVLELISKHYGVSRAYIFENSGDDKYVSNTFEWCSEGVTPKMNSYQNIPQKDFSYYADNFNMGNTFYMPDINDASLEIQKLLKLQDVKSVLQFHIVHEGKIMGLIGFDECRYTRKYEDKELADLKNISNILGMFLSEIRTQEKNIATKNVVMSIVNALDSANYVCDPDTFEILFINDNAKALTGAAREGAKCYKALWNRDKPCIICPMKQLEAKGSNALELYNDHLNFWMKASAVEIDWIDGKKVYLVHVVDITKYKK